MILNDISYHHKDRQKCLQEIECRVAYIIDIWYDAVLNYIPRLNIKCLKGTWYEDKTFLHLFSLEKQSEIL